MKALLPLSIVVSLAAAPAFAACVAPLNDVRIPNGNKATMDEIVAANQAIQENTTEVEAYTHCLKAEQEAKIAAIGPDITDEQKSKIASEYVHRQTAEAERLQKLADLYNAAVSTFRAKQAAAKATEDTNQETAAVNAAEQAAAEKARHEAAGPKADEGAKKPVAPRGN
jgi:type IV secretory pathway VirB10-like protein